MRCAERKKLSRRPLFAGEEEKVGLGVGGASQGKFAFGRLALFILCYSMDSLLPLSIRTSPPRETDTTAESSRACSWSTWRAGNRSTLIRIRRSTLGGGCARRFWRGGCLIGHDIQGLFCVKEWTLQEGALRNCGGQGTLVSSGWIADACVGSRDFDSKVK